jgi:hypothetical protein
VSYFDTDVLHERIAELEQEKKLMIDFARNIFIGSIEQFNQIVESKLKAVQSDRTNRLCNKQASRRN